MPGIVRNVANYHLRFSRELFGRGSLRPVCMQKCSFTLTLPSDREMCSRAISFLEALHNLTLRQAQPAQRMTAALSIAARMLLWVVLASWQRVGIGGADMHKMNFVCRHSTERTQRRRN